MYDSELHIIISIREAEIINFEKKRDPFTVMNHLRSGVRSDGQFLDLTPILKINPLPDVILFDFLMKSWKNGGCLTS